MSDGAHQNQKKKEQKMKGYLRNLITGKIIKVRATLNSPDGSYGLYAWVDRKGESYGQIQFFAPFGYELIKIEPEPKDNQAMYRQMGIEMPKEEVQ